MSYETIDGLVSRLNDKEIEISGDEEIRQLINIGYFHGYKGYRFFKYSDIRLYRSFKEVNATIQYDSNLKSLFYDKVMYIETAVKNNAL